MTEKGCFRAQRRAPIISPLAAITWTKSWRWIYETQSVEKVTIDLQDICHSIQEEVDGQGQRHVDADRCEFWKMQPFGGWVSGNCVLPCTSVGLLTNRFNSLIEGCCLTLHTCIGRCLNTAANHNAGQRSLYFISVNDTAKHLWRIRHINICCSVAALPFSDINLIHLTHTHPSTLSWHCLGAIS